MAQSAFRAPENERASVSAHITSLRRAVRTEDDIADLLFADAKFLERHRPNDPRIPKLYAHAGEEFIRRNKEGDELQAAECFEKAGNVLINSADTAVFPYAAMFRGLNYLLVSRYIYAKNKSDKATSAEKAARDCYEKLKSKETFEALYKGSITYFNSIKTSPYDEEERSS